MTRRLAQFLIVFGGFLTLAGMFGPGPATQSAGFLIAGAILVVGGVISLVLLDADKML